MRDDLKQNSQLFILRLWSEPQTDGRVEWRGRLHYIQTNEVRYFRDWPALIPSLLMMLRQANMLNNNHFFNPSFPTDSETNEDMSEV
jgi:hypothetical protein